MSGRVSGKKVFITGGAQGLGAAMARALADEGALVSVSDINEAGAHETADSINQALGEVRAFGFKHDVTNEDQWISVLEAANAAMGGISGLINNAGIGSHDDIEHLELSAWRRMMEVNVDSVFLGAKHALKYMRDNQPGSIVNISSIAGLIASHNSPGYNASKAAVWLLSKSIALHCARKGLDIRSNSVHPTYIDTPILDPLRERLGKGEAEAKLARQLPLGRLGRPEDVAMAAVYLISDESRFVTGSELKIDGGVSAL